MTTVTVKHIDGTTFQAPSVGKVLNVNYKLTQEQEDHLDRANADPQIDHEAVNRAKEIQAKVDKARELCLKENKSLPRFYDYDFKGNLKSRRK